MRITVEPIGYVSSSRAAAEDDRWDKEISTIQLAPEYSPESLQGLGISLTLRFCITSIRSMHLAW
jgi:hypothetical protein